ncbi:MAG: hypothetical protein ACRCSY_01390 [Cetobacterium sp.]
MKKDKILVVGGMSSEGKSTFGAFSASMLGMKKAEEAIQKERKDLLTRSLLRKKRREKNKKKK